MKFNLKA